MNSNQSFYYRLHVLCGGSAYDIRINDVPLIADHAGNSVETEFPLNQWIRPGPNIISRRLAPTSPGLPLSLEAAGHLELMARAHDEPFDNRRVVDTFPYRPGTDRPDADFLFDADAAFPEPLWFRSHQFSAHDYSLIRILASRLQMLHSLLENAEWQLLLTMMRAKTREVAAALYESPAEREKATLHDLMNFRKRIPGPLVPFDATAARLSVCANSRLVTLVDPQGRPLVRAASKKPPMFASLRTWFCYHSGELIWIR